jgi:hypothetical protein
MLTMKGCIHVATGNCAYRRVARSTVVAIGSTPFTRCVVLPPGVLPEWLGDCGVESTADKRGARANGGRLSAVAR